MIYKDKHAHEDCIDCPSDRYGECCVNCGGSWQDHWNWSCNGSHANQTFFEIDKDKRYLTQSMIDSMSNGIKEIKLSISLPDDLIGFPELIEKKEVLPSDWKVWRDHGTIATNCACGIHRSDCTYHK